MSRSRGWRLALLALLVLAHVRSASATGTACWAGGPVDQATAARLLATERPFTPTDPALFLSYDNPAWFATGAATDAVGPAPTEAEVRADLQAFLGRRFPDAPDRVAQGMAVFAHPIARRKLPDPTLRAALAALTGTLGEPAIDFLLLQAPVTNVIFGIPMLHGQGYPSGNTAITYDLPDGTFTIVFDARFRNNRFATLSALLFHEALHVETPVASTGSTHPDGVGQPEEVTAIALESLVYMQMLLTDPSIATSGDSLTRAGNNRLAVARLNSGRPGTSGLGIFLPDGSVSVDPLAVTPLTQFSDYYGRMNGEEPEDAGWATRETHGNALLAAVLPELAEPGTAPPAAPDFDRATLDFLDRNEAVLSATDLIAVARILELAPACAANGRPA